MKQLLKKHGLATTGNKAELVERAKTIEIAQKGNTCLSAVILSYLKLRINN